MINHLSAYLKNNNQFNFEKLGFWNEKSVTVQLFNLSSLLMSWIIYNGEKLIGIFMDLSIAFNSVCLLGGH